MASIRSALPVRILASRFRSCSGALQERFLAVDVKALLRRFSRSGFHCRDGRDLWVQGIAYRETRLIVRAVFPVGNHEEHRAVSIAFGEHHNGLGGGETDLAAGTVPDKGIPRRRLDFCRGGLGSGFLLLLFGGVGFIAQCESKSKASAKLKDRLAQRPLEA